MTVLAGIPTQKGNCSGGSRSLLSAACPRNPGISRGNKISGFRGQAAESRLRGAVRAITQKVKCRQGIEGKRVSQTRYSLLTKSWIAKAVMIGLLLLPLTVSQAASLYPFQTVRQDAQFKHLLSDLRCLVCQNQDLADSHAPLANDLRMEVYQRVLDGQSDHDIMAYLTDRYGDFILFKPPLKGSTAMLWFAPWFFLGVGLLLFWRKFWVRHHE